MRRIILVANWKMHKTNAEAHAFVEAFLPQVASAQDIELVIAAPATALDRLGRALGGSNVRLACQNVSPEHEGAFTGEVSATMLADVGCRYGIVGHSERRSLFAETSTLAARKAVALQGQGIRPILCVGETGEERGAGRTSEVVGRALSESLSGVSCSGEDLVIAYEPIWAIGTGETATPEMAQEVHAFIRNQLRELYGDVADSMRIQYGGSVKPESVRDLLSQPDIDGLLVGGASLDPATFSTIARNARQESS